MDKLIWRYVKPIENGNSVADFEREFKCNLPLEYTKMLTEINGGRPSRSVFDTEKTSERAVKTFLSFNDSDAEPIAFYNRSADIKNREKYSIFAVDNFGNFIAFDKANNFVWFIDAELPENRNAEYVADNFSQFLGKLY